jgi:hypothetical protein
MKQIKEVIEAKIDALASLIGRFDEDADTYINKRIDKLSEKLEQAKSIEDMMKEAFEAGLKDLFTKAIQDKSILEKIALIDQKWWKSAGLQLSGAILILLGVSIYGPESFSDAEKTRMMNFMKDVEAQLTPEQTQKLALELIINPELSEPLIEVAKTDSLQVIEANQKKIYETLKGNIEFGEAVKSKVRNRVNELKQKKSGKTPE